MTPCRDMADYNNQQESIEAQDTAIFNKALGQIRSYVAAKYLQYGLTDADINEILKTVQDDY